MTLIHGRGGPAQGIGDYPEGAEAAELYLQHVSKQAPDLALLLPVLAIRSFIEEPKGESRKAKLGWPARREALRELAGRIVSQPEWEPLLRSGLASPVEGEFRTAAQAAAEFGLDPWEAYFTRVERGEPDWYFLMQTDDPDRTDRALALAVSRFDLDRIASGPASQLGFGEEYQDHNALDFILQELSRFPGKGWPLLRAGLSSPVIRNRNMALRTLGAWGKAAWPPDAEAVLTRGLAIEPEAGTREWFERVLRGLPADEDEDE
jgi:hypothetical protein